MDVWQATQSWLGLGVIIGAFCAYHYHTKPRSAPAKAASRLTEPIRDVTSTKINKKAQITQSARQRTQNKTAPSSKPAADTKSVQEPSSTTTQTSSKKASQTTSRKKNENDEQDDIDLSTKQFAQQLTQARQGHKITSTKDTEKRTRTVKQANAIDDSFSTSDSSQANDVNETASYSASRDVSDMLEAKPPAPTTLRLTNTTETKRRSTKQSKEELTETKKQRQNRQKVEERRLEREEEEKQRKMLEERQRRTAREARGEPAKNGLASAKAPSSNAWATSSTSLAEKVTQSTPLLDTFEQDSVASQSEAVSSRGSDDTNAPSLAQSIDESGWTTVSIPKKQKKGKAQLEGDAFSSNGSVVEKVAAVQRSQPKVPGNRTSTNTKSNGFQALNDQFEQSSGGDPNNAESWSA